MVCGRAHDASSSSSCNNSEQQLAALCCCCSSSISEQQLAASCCSLLQQQEQQRLVPFTAAEGGCSRGPLSGDPARVRGCGNSVSAPIKGAPQGAPSCSYRPLSSFARNGGPRGAPPQKSEGPPFCKGGPSIPTPIRLHHKVPEGRPPLQGPLTGAPSTGAPHGGPLYRGPSRGPLYRGPSRANETMLLCVR
ncbi:hypothetical protein Emed_007310 [Eimeria media]